MLTYNGQMINRKDLIEILRFNTLIVIFTKADDSERVMRCTLRDDRISSLKSYSSPQAREVEALKGIVTVWDLDKSDWRSFKIDSIKSIKNESDN